MNLDLFRVSGFGFRVSRSACPQVHGPWSVVSSLLVLLSAFPLFAAAPRFADPAGLTMQAATNVLGATTNAVEPVRPASLAAQSAQAGTNLAISQTGTNVPTSGLTNSMDALDDAHKLAIGDRVSFRIVEDEEDPKPLVVTDAGDVEFPYIGRFPAVGKSCRELARTLKAELEKEYYYQATVLLGVDAMAKSRGKVYVVGPVRMPGPQEIPSDEVFTVSKAILRAGGFTDYADKKNVRVTRKGVGSAEQILKVNVAEILDKGRTEGDLKLEAGDLVVVPERLIRF